MPNQSARRIATLVVAIVLALFAAAPGLPAVAASTLTVNTTLDLAPSCQAAAFSLRCAIKRANADGSGDTIAFQIPSSDSGCAGTPLVCTLRPTSALPPLTAAGTLIDGYTQPGSAVNSHAMRQGDNARIAVRLDGSKAAKGADGLTLQGSGDTVRGLAITGFILCDICTGIPGQITGGSGVHIDGSGEKVTGDFIGLLTDGRTAAPNQFAGVNVFGTGSNSIGGENAAAADVLSGNGLCTLGDCYGFGVYVESGAGTVVERSYVGTSAAGSAAVGNLATGVVILSAGNTLGSGSNANLNVVSSNGGDGVLLGGANTTLAHNIFGLTAAGTGELGNHSHGIDVQSAGNAISTNLVSGNGDTGIVLLGTGNVVTGNRVGTDAAGAVAHGNGFHPSGNLFGQLINGTDGIAVCVGPNTIGGSGKGQGNLVSGNAGDGIALVSSGNSVRGNIVGLDLGGTRAIGNKVDGIGSQSAIFKGVGFCQQAPQNGGSNNTVIGNLVSGNAGHGLNLFENSADRVQGNRVGTNSAASGPVPNGGHGIVLAGGCDEQVCIPASGNKLSGNVIGGNLLDGIHVEGTGNSQSNTITGNLVGTDAGGTLAIANLGNGIFLGFGALNDLVGGTSLGSGNTIAFNRGAGVLIGGAAADSGTHSAVEGNSLFANVGLGIDLAPNGIVNCTTTPPGPNDYTACPVITSATARAVTGTACGGCRVEVYLAADAGDLGHGEGKTLLGATTAGTGGSWTVPLAPGQVAQGQQVTATATTPAAFTAAAETSEFAANTSVS
jgi:parallel beta-helix repeat protein